MISYKDKTFCNSYKQCKYGDICDRALTLKIEKQAKEFGLGICQYINKPECFKEKG